MLNWLLERETIKSERSGITVEYANACVFSRIARVYLLPFNPSPALSSCQLRDVSEPEMRLGCNVRSYSVL